MSRHKEKRLKDRDRPTPDLAISQAPLISKRGWKMIGVGISLLVGGFVLLSFTDPRGQNIPSQLSPFIIIGGYALIGWGIISKDPPTF